MRLTIVNVVNGNPDGFEFHVHRCGCRDLGKPLYKSRSNPRWDSDGATPEAIIAEEVANFQDQGQDYSAADFRVFPCVCC